MRYSEYTRNTNEFFKGYAHKRRYMQATRIISPKATDVILDYGCGDAHLFEHFEHIPRSQLTAYDPVLEMIQQIPDNLRQEISVYSDRDQLLEDRKRYFSVIVCMEVCEHLSDSKLRQLLIDIRQLARRDARVIIGVPIETGISGFFKNIYRIIHGGRMGATWSRAFQSLLGRRMARDFVDGWTHSHIGFREDDLVELLISEGFQVKKGPCVPFKFLGRLFNNESYLLASVK